MATLQHPVAPSHLPWFVTAPGNTDILYVITTVIVIVSAVLIGVMFFWLHSLPERLGHKKLQFEIVAVLGLISLFTHMHVFWIVGLLLALIDLPDILSPLRRIAVSAERLASTDSTSVPTMKQPSSESLPSKQDELSHRPQSHFEETVNRGRNRKLLVTAVALVVAAVGTFLFMNLDSWMWPLSKDPAPVQKTTVAPPAVQNTPEGTPTITKPTANSTDPHDTTQRLQPSTEPAPTVGAARSGENVMAEAPASRSESVSEPVTIEQPVVQPESDSARIPQQPAPSVVGEWAKRGENVMADTPTFQSQSVSEPAATRQPETESVRTPQQPVAPAVGKEGGPTIDTVRIYDLGDAIIMGRAAPGSEIIAKLDGTQIGKVTANADGSFVLVPPTPLPVGRGTLTLESRGPNETIALASEKAISVTVPPRDQEDPDGKGPPPDSMTGIPTPAEPVTQGPTRDSSVSPDIMTKPAVDLPGRTASKKIAPSVIDKDATVTKTPSRQKRRKSKDQRENDDDLTTPPKTESSEYHKLNRPYWIDERCAKGRTKCTFRLRYLPGQDLTVVDPDGYWYGVPKQRKPSSMREHPNHSKHVNWCKKRFRTYNSNTDHFVGRDHKRYRCNSPFDGQPLD